MKMKLSPLLVLAAMAAPGFAQTATPADHARVRSTAPVFSEVQVPRTECTSQTIVAAQSHQHNVAGIGIGAVAGGLLGHTVGGGNGNAAATAVGAVAGALVGNNIANRTAAPAEPAATEVQSCMTVMETQSRLLGYRVRYEWAGREYEAMLPSDPGKTLPVRVSVLPADAR